VKSLPSQVEYQIYPEEYFSGSDISIYFGDVWVDEVVAINFSLVEHVQPIYGFNSYTWDAVARGSRIIQGTFRINFKETNYLNKILMEQSTIENNLEYWKRHPAERINIDDFDKTIKLYKDNPEEMRERLKYMSKEEIAKVAAELNDTTYGTSTVVSSNPHFFKHYGRNSRGFDIIILYGSATQSIVKKKEYEQRYMIPAATSYKIKNIQLNGLSQDIAPDGTVIYEDYSFMAQDLELIN